MLMSKAKRRNIKARQAQRKPFSKDGRTRHQVDGKGKLNRVK